MSLISEERPKMKSKKQYVISHPSQLNSLSVLPLAKISGIGTIRLTGTFEGHPQRAEFEEKLNKQYRACGCDSSAKSLIVGVAASAAFAAFRMSTGEWSLGYSVAVVLGVSVLALGAGKLYGLVRANGRLKKTLRDIQEIWIPEKGHKEENAACG
jgi:hypothetical protein